MAQAGTRAKMAAGRWCATTAAASSILAAKIRNPTPMGRVGPVVLICEPARTDVASSSSVDNIPISTAAPIKPSPPAIVTAVARRDPAKPAIGAFAIRGREVQG